MQTASEWVERYDDVNRDPDTGMLTTDACTSGTVTFEQAETRDREVRLDERIKTLREAARLVCESCADGYGSVRDHREKGSCVWHGSGKCGASLLHDRIAELEAERDNG